MSLLAFASVVSLVGSGAAATALKCSGSFSQIAASTWVNGANPGWNLGNTLDAVPTEGSWNNPPVNFPTFDDVKRTGFKGVRLPGRSPSRSLERSMAEQHQ